MNDLIDFTKEAQEDRIGFLVHVYQTLLKDKREYYYIANELLELYNENEIIALCNKYQKEAWW